MEVFLQSVIMALVIIQLILITICPNVNYAVGGLSENWEGTNNDSYTQISGYTGGAAVGSYRFVTLRSRFDQLTSTTKTRSPICSTYFCSLIMANSDKRIVYLRDDGGVTILTPSDNCSLTVEEIASKDVPTGKKYKID